MMQRFKMHNWWRTMALCALGMLAVALFTSIAFRLQVGLGVASFYYLLLLVLQSLSGDFFSSAVVSLSAASTTFSRIRSSRSR